MAMQTSDSPSVLPAQTVANMFVQQYYKVLSCEPDSVHKFYEDSSVLSCPFQDGKMKSATTMKGIKDMILSLDYNGYKAEIITIDAQYSCKEGVIVLVTGHLTGKDRVKRTFTQTFFLAKNVSGYYVLNHIFVFVDGLGASTPSLVNDANENVPIVFVDGLGASTPSSVNDGNENVPTTPDQESACVPNQPSQNHSSPNSVYSSDVESLAVEEPLVEEAVVSEPLSSDKNDGDTVSECSSNVQEVPGKKSYANMVITAASPVQKKPNNVVIVAPSSNYHGEPRPSAAPKAASQNSITQTDVKSIFIRNLPSDASAKQIEAIFKKYGPIKKEGIKIRYSWNGNCYGFVEFQSSHSARKAIEAHKIQIGSNEVYISERRYNNQGGNGSGRFPSGKSELPNDNYRGRENSVEGHGYGRNLYGNRGESLGQMRGNGEAPQRGDQNGGGRTADLGSGASL